MSRRKEKTRLGELLPRHTFFLNPYPDQRFTRCPGCDEKTKARKKPFLIHIDPMELMLLNMTGRYCETCDLIILHKDVVEDLMARAFALHNPSVIGNEYLIIGTVESSYWRKYKGKATMGPAFENLHDFEKVVVYEVIPAHWGPAEPGEDKKKE
jgi:hypothetical protein